MVTHNTQEIYEYWLTTYLQAQWFSPWKIYIRNIFHTQQVSLKLWFLYCNCLQLCKSEIEALSLGSCSKIPPNRAIPQSGLMDKKHLRKVFLGWASCAIFKRVSALGFISALFILSPYWWKTTWHLCMQNQQKGLMMPSVYETPVLTGRGMSPYFCTQQYPKGDPW